MLNAIRFSSSSPLVLTVASLCSFLVSPSALSLSFSPVLQSCPSVLSFSLLFFLFSSSSCSLRLVVSDLPSVTCCL
eukprot:m.781843 g.781843  ORF g.781843 m.781843 type:complete len:76 (+) comp59149_c0_seq5:311-538(+)